MTNTQSASVPLDGRHIKEWFILRCGHEVAYEIRPGWKDVVLCVRCGKGVHIKCMQITARCRDCPYTRAFGVDLFECRRKATVHSYRYPNHRILIRGKHGEKLEVITGRYRNAPLL